MAHVTANGGHHAHAHDHEHDHESLKTFGFWIFLITDVILFGSLFATYMVLHQNTNGDLHRKSFSKCRGSSQRHSFCLPAHSRAV